MTFLLLVHHSCPDIMQCDGARVHFENIGGQNLRGNPCIPTRSPSSAEGRLPISHTEDSTGSEGYWTQGSHARTLPVVAGGEILNTGSGSGLAEAVLQQGGQQGTNTPFKNTTKTLPPIWESQIYLEAEVGGGWG